MQPLADNTDAATGQDEPIMTDTTSPPKAKVQNVPASMESRPATPVVEINGPTGPDPCRYGDWERRGRCIDF